MRRELLAKKITLLVIDGLIAAQRVAMSDQAFNEFVHELQGIAIGTNTTVLLIASADRHPKATPEHTMVDGIIEMSDQRSGWATNRVMQLTKIRGTDYLRGHHSYEITNDGLVIYPRIETLPPGPSVADDSVGRVRTGIENLDTMLGGGLPRGSPTMLMGPSGVGKTTLGLQFLAECSATEPGLLYGFYETPARIASKAREICPTLAGHLVAGAVEMMWHPPTVDSLDAYGDRLLTAVRARRVQRLFLDGLDAFHRTRDADERLRQFMPALTNELREQGVTTIYTLEVGNIIGASGRTPFDNFSMLAENLIVLRYVESGPRLHRLISILKVRDSDFDPLMHEFTITAGGLQILPSSASAQMILRGDSRRNEFPAATPSMD